MNILLVSPFRIAGGLAPPHVAHSTPEVLQATGAATPPRRPAVSYSPSMWDDGYIQSLGNNEYYCIQGDGERERMEKLKQEVRGLLMEADVGGAGLAQQLELVDLLQGLGVGRHFEKEVDGILSEAARVATAGDAGEALKGDLSSTALLFRLLRQHGHRVSQDIFNRFREEPDDSFEAYLHGGDIRETLSLFEATLHGQRGESTFDAARATTLKRLQNQLATSVEEGIVDGNLREEVVLALELPPNRRIDRLQARWLLEMSARRRDMVHPALHELAVLDFNRVQSIHMCGLKKMSRWDVTAAYELPQYMQVCYLTLLNTVDQMCHELQREKEGWDVLPFLKKAWTDICRAFLIEAKWCYEKHMPTFEDYMGNAWMSISVHVVLAHAVLFMDLNMTEKDFEHLRQYPPVIRHSATIFRLLNDLVEREGWDTPSSIACYMNENGATEEAARRHLKNLIEETWSSMNQEIASSSLPARFMAATANVARLGHCLYQHGDGHSKPGKEFKLRVRSLLMEPIIYPSKTGCNII